MYIKKNSTITWSSAIQGSGFVFIPNYAKYEMEGEFKKNAESIVNNKDLYYYELGEAI